MLDMLIRSGQFFLTILAELMPLFLIVTFLSGLALEYISPEKLRKGLSGRNVTVDRSHYTPVGPSSDTPALFVTFPRESTRIGVQ